MAVIAILKPANLNRVSFAAINGKNPTAELDWELLLQYLTVYLSTEVIFLVKVQQEI